MTAFDNIAQELTELDHRVERLETQDTALIAGTGGVSGAPSDAQYIVVGFSGDLSQERRLASGNGMGVFVDGGANGDFTVVLGTPGTLTGDTTNALTANSHTHAITTGTPVNIGNANAEGVAASMARSDHVHNHPAGLGTDLHHALIHTHANAGEGGQLDWDNIWSDAVHSHANAGEGGQLDWDNIWSDAVHDHSSNGEGGQLIDLNGAADALVLDADGDTTISAPVGNQIDIEIAGADDFTFTANALNVLASSAIVMADGTTIGQAAGPLLRFDDTNDLLEITGCKVGIGTTTVPHAGVGAALLALEGTIGSAAAGPHIQITTTSDNYPLFQMLNWSHDNIHLVFDAYYDGAWKSSDPGSSFAIVKTTDLLRFRYDVAAAGGAIAWNEGLVLTTAGFFGVNTTTPRQRVDILDASNPQLRLTQSDNVDYADFQVDGNGLLTVTTVDGGGAAGHIALMPDGGVGMGTATVPHGGVGAALLALEGTDSNVVGPHIQTTTASDNYPLLQIRSWAHDEIEITFDAYYDGAWRSSEPGAAFQIQKNNDKLNILVDTGTAPGVAVNWITALTVENAFGWIGINSPTPAAPLEIISTQPQLRLTHTDGTDYVTLGVDGNGLLTVTTVDGGGAAGHIALMPDGNVGIGIAAAASKLHVVDANSNVFRYSIDASAVFTSVTGMDADAPILLLEAVTAKATGIWYRSGAVDWFAGITSAADDKFVIAYEANAPFVALTNAGDLGVNTVIPRDRVDILDTTTQLRLTHTDNTDYATFAVDGDGKTTITTVDGVGAAGHLIFAPDGSVGIKEATPLVPVHITHTGASNTWDLTNEQTVVIEDDDCVLQMVGNDASTAMVHIVMSNSTAASPRKNWIISHRGPDAANAFTIDYKTSAGAWDVASGTPYLNILTSGFVGINETGPTHPLQITVDAADAIECLKLQQDDTDDEFIYFEGTSANVNLTRSIVETADAVGTLVGWLKMYINDKGTEVADGAYFMPFYSLAAP